MNQLCVRLEGVLGEIVKDGLLKTERIITSEQSEEITVSGLPNPVLNFCSNNYLGLSSHPNVIEAAKRTIDERGFGMSSVRFICGTQDIHRELERLISQFHGMEDAILYASCFDANTGLFEQILGPEDAVISDALNHASIIDGIRLCKAKRLRYKHMDLSDLERCLIETQSNRIRLIVTDGVFSMDGDFAPLKQICDLADKYKAQVFIDECHAAGFVGNTGRGTTELCGVEGRVDIINSTLGKALGGGMGGYTTGPKAIIDLLRQRSRPYLFSNTLVPSVVGASIEVFNMLINSSSLIEKLRENVHQFRMGMSEAGFDLNGNEQSAIVPVMIGNAIMATKMSEKLLEKGIYVVAFSYPVVPKGSARIRCQISALHSENQICDCISAFVSVGREIGILS